MASGPIRRKSERAVRDISGNPATLLYDELNDQTVMARSTPDGESVVTDKDLYWRQVRYAYDVDDNVEYKGLHTDHDVGGADTGYWIIKYTYTTGNVTRKQYLEGAWDSRAGLSW